MSLTNVSEWVWWALVSAGVLLIAAALFLPLDKMLKVEREERDP